ncbi:MAG: PAS domain S-box protein [Actinomycetota bacterium]
MGRGLRGGIRTISRALPGARPSCGAPPGLNKIWTWRLTSTPSSRRRSSATSSTSPSALLVVDDKMRILVANEAAADLSGYTVEELTSLQSWQITGDPEQSARNAKGVHLGGRLASQSAVRHKEGHLVPCAYFAWEVGIAAMPFIAILLWPEEPES